jgi:hypothetical protein
MASATRLLVEALIGAAPLGKGWLIFSLPGAELAAHPAEDAHHEIYLMCDDVQATVAELTAKGVRFPRPLTETDWGTVTALELHGGDELAIYEPKHPSPLPSVSSHQLLPSRV